MSNIVRTSSSLWKSSRFFYNKFSASPAIAQAHRSFSNPSSQAPAAKSQTRRDINEPIKFVGSPAHSWTAKKGRSGTIDVEEVPWFQAYVVVGSVAAFLIYFCILREENDVDEEMGRTLYERIPGLEQSQLIVLYKYNLENNNDNSQIVARMKELGMNPNDIKL